MALTPGTIKASGGSKRSAKRLGRGNGSGKGTYSGRGLKGQRSRSGGKSGTKRRGFKQSLQKIPKLRGFNSPHTPKHTVTLYTLNRVFQADEVVTPRILMNKGVVSDIKSGVKIVARGKIEKKILIKDCLASKKAIELIEKAGGKLEF
jgi:large subunit ribosomal protein L15